MCAAIHDRFLRIFAVAVCVLLVHARADGEDKKGQSYDISVWAIRATKSNTQVSPELKPIAQELKKRFKYTGFKLERKKSGRAGEGKTLSTDLIAGFKAKVTPLERKGSRVKLKIEVTKREGGKDKRLAGTTFTITRGRFQLLGGWRIDPKSEDVLIVAVSAR